MATKNYVIYVYRNNVESTKGLVKVGQTTYTGRSKVKVQTAAMNRIKQDHTTNGAEFELLDCFVSKHTDKEFHSRLAYLGCKKNVNNSAREWFDCNVEIVRLVEEYLNTDDDAKARMEVVKKLSKAIEKYKNNLAEKDKAILEQSTLWVEATSVAGAANLAKKRHKENNVAKSANSAKNIGKAMGLDATYVADGSYDEYLTRYWNIEREIMGHKEYTDYFYGKSVMCPADDTNSNFFRFFYLNFKKLGLTKLTCTSFCFSPLAFVDNKTGLRLQPEAQKAWRYEVTMDDNGELKTKKTRLKGNGDFRSMEIIDLMKKHDCICTNPPFGEQARDFYSVLTSIDVKFLFICSHTFGAIKKPLEGYNKGLWQFGFEEVHKFQFRTTDLVISRKTQEKKKRELKSMEDMVGLDDNGLPVYENKLCVNELCKWYTNILPKGIGIEKGYTEKLLMNTVVGNEDCYPRVENVENCIVPTKRTKDGNYLGNALKTPADWDGLMLVPASMFYNNRIDSRYFEIVGNGNLSKDVALPLSDITKQKYLEQTGSVVSNGNCVYTNANGIVKSCGGLFLLIKWKVKEREALKKELGL